MEPFRFDFIFWNVENLFAPETGGPRRDYTPEQGWTAERLDGKIGRIVSILSNSCGLPSSAGDPGEDGGISGAPVSSEAKPPPIIGLCEVESVEMAARIAALLPGEYRAIGDGESIASDIEYCDTVLIYDSAVFCPVYSKYHSLTPRFPKGDILEARFRGPGEEELTVFSCHWKARTREHTYTETFRSYAGDYLQQLIWKLHGGEGNSTRRGPLPAHGSIVSAGLDPGGAGDGAGSPFPRMPAVIVAGDFNDEPFSRSLRLYLKASWDRNFVSGQRDPATVFLYNAAFEGLMGSPGGTNYFENEFGTPWSMLDQIALSPSVVAGTGPCAYLRDSFRIITRGIAGTNGIPRRICGWDDEDRQFWVDDGLSDHFPVAATFDWRAI